MERVALHLQDGVTRRQRWQNGSPAHWAFADVTVGTLADGRWFCGISGRHPGSGDAWVCADEGHARRLAAAAMSGDGWREVPAAYDANALPVDAHRWRRSGGAWVLAEPEAS